jgi:hypothetical protein
MVAYRRFAHVVMSLPSIVEYGREQGLPERA